MKLKNYLACLGLLFAQPAHAAISQINGIWTTSLPDTPNTFITTFCQMNDWVWDLTTNNIYRQNDCAGTPHNVVVISSNAFDLLKQTSMASIASTLFTGNTTQIVRGDGSVASFAHSHAASDITSGTKTSAFISDFTTAARAAFSAGSEIDITSGVISAVPKSYNYATRSLNTCFRPSATRDALVTYAVDIATTLSLTGGTTGTVYLRTYTNSSCTTGTQEITRFVNGNTGTLTIGLNITQNATGTLTGVIPAGNYVQLVTENTIGTPTFTARPGQETLF